MKQRMHSLQTMIDDEELEMSLDLNYGMNASCHYAEDPDNSLDVSLMASNVAERRTSVTQTYIDDVNDKGISRKTEYCMVPFYTMVSVLSAVTTALLLIREISESLGFAILISFTLIGAMVGMYGVYSWGVFQDVLDYLIVQNKKYRMNINRLNSVGEVLQNDVNDINHSVDYLKRDGNTLEQAMNAYNGLKKELQTICDKMNEKKEKMRGHHENVMDLLSELDEQCDALNAVIEDNEKAHLLSIFYSVKLYDYGQTKEDFNCLNKKQYTQFLRHCNTSTRAKFEQYGGFEALDTEKKGVIDVDKFERMVHKVLAVTIEQSQHSLKSSIKIKKGNL